MSTSKLIKNKILKSKGSFFANDNISEFVGKNDLDNLSIELQEAISKVLDVLIIDTQNDHNTKETAKRVAKMYLEEVFVGRYTPMPKITQFPNTKNLDEIYTLGPITIRSTCSHHMVPITGKAWIGVLPSDKLIGISKFVRLTNWIMNRLQIQEESTIQLADLIEKLIKPRALGVIVEATHNCMTVRGVKENETKMTTSVMRGLFRDGSSARTEFLKLIGK